MGTIRPTAHAYQRWRERAHPTIRSYATFLTALATARYWKPGVASQELWLTMHRMVIVVERGRAVTVYPLRRRPRRATDG